MTHDEPEKIEAVFRGGSLTAVSVIVGFSLGFLARWASEPGMWNSLDLGAVAAIVAGITLQIAALTILLDYSSLLMRVYRRAIRIFLAGLAFVAIGVAAALVGDVVGVGQHVLGR